MISKRKILFILLNIILLLYSCSCSQKFTDNGSSATANDDNNPSEEEQPVDISIPECNENCYCVRANAAGSGTGLDWDNAFTVLPDNLERNAIYYIASGDYAGRTFDDNESGDQYIYIIKATSNNHATDTGWKPEYGAGYARFGSLSFNSPYYILDGLSGRGFEIIGGYQGAVVRIRSDYITIRNCYLNGNFTTDASDYHVDGSCIGLSIYADYTTIKNCDIYDVADDGLEMHGGSHLAFLNNKIYNLHSCGSDGGCGPCYNGHSDSMELFNVKNSEISGNFLYDTIYTTNAALFFGNWASSPAEYCENIKLINNIFYMPRSGFVAYFIDVAGLKVYNNVFWGIRDGRYGGLCMGQTVTDMDMYNNIILSVDYHHLNATYDPANHRGDYNLFSAALGYYSEQANDIVNNDPGFVNIPAGDGAIVTNPTAADFQLKTASPCKEHGFSGNSGNIMPTIDFFGNTRPSGDRFDIGAHEYQN